MLGSLISAGTSLLGGLLGRSSSKSASQANYKAQKEFAQHGIRWKVEDAKAAGVSPLFALGAPATNFSPSFVGDTGLATGLAGAGQDIGGAIDRTRTSSERVSARLEGLQLERAGLENELLRSQIRRLSMNPVPGIPDVAGQNLIPGQGNTPLVKVNQQDVTVAQPGAPQSEAGAIADVGYARTGTGYAPVPSYDVKQRIEDQLIPELMWSLRNNIAPTLGFNHSVPYPAPKGFVWHYSPWRQEYQLVKATGYGGAF